MKRLIVIGFLFTCLGSVWAQQTPDLLEDLVAYMAENSEEELDVEELTATWEYYLKHPLNLNAVHFADLKELRILSDFQIDKLLTHRDLVGRFLSIYELASLDGFTPDLVAKLQPFLVFGETEDHAPKMLVPEGEVLSRIGAVMEKEKGYDAANGYVGSPVKYYLRTKYSHGSWNGGFTGEKDAGEAFFREPVKAGFDFTSFFLNTKWGKKQHQLLLGDFIVRAGQGLVLWQGFGSGKSTQIDQICRFAQGIRSYSSANEIQFFRGAAAEFSVNNGKIRVFQSFRKVDANLKEQDGRTIFTSMPSSGLHRTDGEIADKHSVQELVSGVLLNYQKNKFSLGLAGLYTAFNRELIPDERLSNQFLFRGRSLVNASADFRWSFQNMFFFGEWAMSSTGGWACTNGAVLKPNDRLVFSLLFRSFSLRYNSLFAQAVSESSRINDEQGLYGGVRFLPLPHVSVSAYHDFYRFRWLKYQTAAPSEGAESFIQLDYTPDKRVHACLRYFSEEKENQQTDGIVKRNGLVRIQKLRAGFDVQLNDQFTLKTRLEYSYFGEGRTEKGMLILQDVGYQFGGLPLRVQLRFAWFDTDSYNARLYTYENDVLYGYSVPALAGKGVRLYLNAKYELSKNIDLWFKISRTQYANETSMGNGLSEIADDRKTEWKLQLRFRF